MQRYIGTKIVHAEPHDRLVPDEVGGVSKEPGYKVVYEDGYVSWSPKDIFERANRRVDGMSFGLAIEALKKGLAVQRAGWNGKNMHLYLEDHYSAEIQVGAFKGHVRKYDDVICMFTAQETHQPGWLASQADMLADDWRIVEIS